MKEEDFINFSIKIYLTLFIEWSFLLFIYFHKRFIFNVGYWFNAGWQILYNSSRMSPTSFVDWREELECSFYAILGLNIFTPYQYIMGLRGEEIINCVFWLKILKLNFNTIKVNFRTKLYFPWFSKQDDLELHDAQILSKKLRKFYPLSSKIIIKKTLMTF